MMESINCLSPWSDTIVALVREVDSEYLQSNDFIINDSISAF